MQFRVFLPVFYNLVAFNPTAATCFAKRFQRLFFAREASKTKNFTKCFGAKKSVRKNYELNNFYFQLKSKTLLRAFQKHFVRNQSNKFAVSRFFAADVTPYAENRVDAVNAVSVPSDFDSVANGSLDF